MNFQLKDGKELIINGRQIAFEQRIDDIIALPDRIIIGLLTDDFAYGDPMVGRNILAFGADGQLLWRVEDHKCVIGANPEDTVTQPDADGSRWIPQSFLGLWVSKETGEIRAVTPSYYFSIDPDTGALYNEKENR